MKFKGTYFLPQCHASRAIFIAHAHKPPDNRHTDKAYRLVLVLLAPKLGASALFCTGQEWSLTVADNKRAKD